jgi:hypothetical protein
LLIGDDPALLIDILGSDLSSKFVHLFLKVEVVVIRSEVVLLQIRITWNIIVLLPRDLHSQRSTLKFTFLRDYLHLLLLNLNFSHDLGHIRA